MGEASTQPHPALPAGATVEPAGDLRMLSQGRILIGGAPFTITRLSDAGGALVKRWFAGEPIGDSAQQQNLARRLIRSGMAHPRWESHRSKDRLGHVTVIIPVKDDQAGLDVTLAALTNDNGGHRFGSIIVVDDGSRDPMRVAGAERADLAISVVRNASATGPGQARQLGAELADPETFAFVFVDAGVAATPDALDQLLHLFDDQEVVAAAPRVASNEADHLVGRFDRARSPLDLGPGPSLVGPGRHVPYVPSACLLVRADALAKAGPFDPAMRYGEDVDLVWRLGSIGEVRYAPSVIVQHPPRPNLVAMAKQRRSYGSAAGPLAARHGDAVAPVRVSPWTALVFGLALSGRPLAALATIVGNGLALRPKIEPLPDLTAEAVLLTARGHWYGSLSILTAAVRAWSPLLIIGWLLVPTQRRRLGAVGAAAFARRLLDGPKGPRAAMRDLALGAIDDLSYCAGVWEGVARHRSIGSLKAILPASVSWPKPRLRGSDATKAGALSTGPSD